LGFIQVGGAKFEDAVVIGRMFSHQGLEGHDEVLRGLLDYVKKHAPRYLEMQPGWQVPPETPGDPWKRRDLSPQGAPSTGLRARIYRC